VMGVAGIITWHALKRGEPEERGARGLILTRD
jgi:hypothetical protein